LGGEGSRRGDLRNGVKGGKGVGRGAGTGGGGVGGKRKRISRELGKWVGVGSGKEGWLSGQVGGGCRDI